MSEWNAGIIDEFRAKKGQVGGPFEGRPLLLLHHKGAKTGTPRVSPLMYQSVDGGYAVFASKAGADNNPDWFHNVIANPETQVEVGSDTVNVRVRVAEGAEQDRIWKKQKEDFPHFAEYEAKTSRSQIPVLILEPF
jgi:deazaflavin-dependent oxidoreductase (nitroreductase family)